MYNWKKFKKALKKEDLEDISNNLFRYHKIIETRNLENLRETTFKVGRKTCIVFQISGEFKRIQH